MEQSTPVSIAVVGMWHLGLVTSVCLADLGFLVVGVDPDPKRVERLNQGQAPLFEPGIAERLTQHLASGVLRYTADMDDGVRDASHVLIAFDTPVDQDDEVDLREIYGSVETMAVSLRQDVTVIISSQVPVGTCEELASIVRANRPDLSFEIACVPENLRLGQAIQRFLHPDMIVVGADDAGTYERVERVYDRVQAPRVHVNLRTAEMTKHAINAYLATTISFANELANICDLVGADAVHVVEALRLDARVSPRAPLDPGFGFSGGTLARDMKALQRIAQQHDYEAPMIEGVLARNRLQNTVALRNIERFYGGCKGLTVGLLGLTYKPGTSTIRRSSAIEMLTALVSRGASVRAYDPMADPAELAPYQRTFTRCDSAYEVATGSHALVLATPWPEFKELDFDRLRSSMSKPLLVDPGNVLDADEMVRAGFAYQGVGRGTSQGSGDVGP